MIRRSIAGLLLGPSLLIGSLAWSGFVALQTVFDANRSRDIAEELLDNDQVRGQLTDNLATAIEATLPTGVVLTDEQVEQAAASALQDPAVEELVLTALTSAHGAFLGEGDVPHTLDLTPVTEALRSAVIEAAPAIDQSLPIAPAVRVGLPTERIPNAGPIRTFLQRAVPIMAAVAIAGAVLALVTTTDRASILTRAGVWALSTTVFYLVIGLGLPWLLRQYAPAQAEVVAALAAALLRSTLVPSLVLALCGVTAVATAIMWPDGARGPEPGRQEAVRSRTPVPTGQRRAAWPGPVPQPMVYPEPTPGPRVDPTMVDSRVESSPAVSRPAPRPPMRAVTPLPPPPRPDRPAPLPTVASTGRPRPEGPAAPGVDEYSSSRPSPPADPSRGPSNRLRTTEQDDRGAKWLPPRWVEGHGWVLDPDDPKPPPPNARWVEGVGHVVPGPPPRG